MPQVSVTCTSDLEETNLKHLPIKLKDTNLLQLSAKLLQLLHFAWGRAVPKREGVLLHLQHTQAK